MDYCLREKKTPKENMFVVVYKIRGMFIAEKSLYLYDDNTTTCTTYIHQVAHGK